jgi:hypothetical protein
MGTSEANGCREHPQHDQTQYRSNGDNFDEMFSAQIQGNALVDFRTAYSIFKVNELAISLPQIISET